jgi:ubiquinone/menaquinone biosynthesis C-methylase UbiE
MWSHRVVWRFLRFAFHLFYNPFAFTYDLVSAVVSRGRWRAWTRAAIPRIQGARVLEVPCGTGNLLLDLYAAGYAPIGVDLSPSMLNITRGKFGARAKHSQRFGFSKSRSTTASLPNDTAASTQPQLARARVQALPFRTGAFDSVVMTFPPGFDSDPDAFTEIRRVLNERGRFVWVDGARFKSGWWGHMVNRWTGFVGSEIDFERAMKRALCLAGFDAQVEWVEDAESVIAVATATRKESV